LSFAVHLGKSGLRHSPRSSSGERELQVVRPASVPDLLRFWSFQLEGVDEDVTLGDLLDLLREVEDIDSLSGFFACDIEEFLDEAALPSVKPLEDVRYLEVYNMADLDGYVPGKRRKGGRFTPPYFISRGFHGWGSWSTEHAPEGAQTEGGLAIEFCPLNDLVHVPLRYNPRIEFRDDNHDVAFETEITITFGEFVFAVLWEIGFLGSPGDRNEQRGEIEARVAEIEAGTVDLIPFEDVVDLLGFPEEDEDRIDE
jgi:hypothetical protein